MKTGLPIMNSRAVLLVHYSFDKKGRFCGQSTNDATNIALLSTNGHRLQFYDSGRAANDF